MFKFRSNSGQKCSPEPEQKCCSGTGTGIPVDLWLDVTSKVHYAYIRHISDDYETKKK